jgi:hypothetical protein
MISLGVFQYIIITGGFGESAYIKDAVRNFESESIKVVLPVPYTRYGLCFISFLVVVLIARCDYSSKPVTLGAVMLVLSDAVVLERWRPQREWYACRTLGMGVYLPNPKRKSDFA